MFVLLFFMALLLSLKADAATVCRVISTGQVVETSGQTQASGVCLADLSSSGIPKDDIEQLTATETERKQHLKAWDDNPSNPEKAKIDAKKSDRTSARAKLKSIGLTEKELDALQ